jgi:hypothetical protein
MRGRRTRCRCDRRVGTAEPNADSRGDSEIAPVLDAPDGRTVNRLGAVAGESPRGTVVDHTPVADGKKLRGSCFPRRKDHMLKHGSILQHSAQGRRCLLRVDFGCSAPRRLSVVSGPRRGGSQASRTVVAVGWNSRNSGWRECPDCRRSPGHHRVESTQVNVCSLLRKRGGGRAI